MSEPIISKPSSTGVKLLSAFKRAVNSQSVDQIQPSGLSTILIAAPVMGIAPVLALGTILPVGPIAWPVRQHTRYKFSGDQSATSAAPGAVSLEAAGLALVAGTRAFPFKFAGTGTGFSRVNAARLSATTALLENAPISFDDWLIDCDDLLVAYPGAELLMLFSFMSINKVGGGGVQVRTDVRFEAVGAQFNDYRFDQWE